MDYNYLTTQIKQEKEDPNNALGLPNSGLGLPNTGLGLPNSGLGLPNSGLGLPNSGLGLPNNGLGLPNNGLGLPNNGLVSTVESANNFQCFSNPSTSDITLNSDYQSVKQEASAIYNQWCEAQAFPSTFNPYYFSNNYPQEAQQGPVNDSLKALKPSKTLKKSAKSKKEKSSPTKLNKNSSPRKKFDRFDGVPEEDVAQKFLPDHLAHNLDILIIGINPGLFAAHKGHHYAGPGNHFWKCLFLSGFTSEQYTAYDDFKMLEFGIGFTNIVARTTRGSSDLTRQEIAQGGEILLTKLQYYKPKIAVFNGKGIYEIFSKKKKFSFGKQPEKIDGTETIIWVMPSSSARCAQLPRAVDKVPFYAALKKLRDHLNGSLPILDEKEIVFTDLKLTCPPRKNVKIEQVKTEPT